MASLISEADEYMHQQANEKQSSWTIPAEYM